jgi:hypothetical protein
MNDVAENTLKLLAKLEAALLLDLSSGGQGTVRRGVVHDVLRGSGAQQAVDVCSAGEADGVGGEVRRGGYDGVSELFS